MDSLLWFGVGSTTKYTFDPSRQVSYDDNFKDIRQQAVAVPGKHGGISPYGLGSGPSESGNVSVSYILVAPDGASGEWMGYQLDRISEMSTWGVQRLVKRSMAGNLVWTWASVSSNPVSFNARNTPHKQIAVPLTFQCQDSRWYSKDGLVFWNDGWTWDASSLVIPSLKLDQEAVMNGSTVIVTNNGNAPASAFVRWEGNGSDTFSNPKIERANQYGQVVDSLLYTKDFAATDVVEIDGRRLSVTNRSALTRTSGAWLEIPPGDVALTISGTFAGTALLTIDFWDTWV